ncbi:MAG: hypothetical protein IPG44_09340 [Anaerolineales bacterium]|jgi:hypothetical protein|nr:hypothetical protein [Chloroflexota bacterium]MBK6645943.1 hypothetical protein [Anaerolineales bacterium]MCC6986907.1 hypothetical protein [Anaerolineales bacterium]
MEQESAAPKKSNRPLVALLLSISSIFFCCLSFLISNPNNFDAYMENNPAWYIGQALMCLAGLLPLIGAILGGLSLRAGETNRNFAIAALVVGIIAFIGSALITGYVMTFIGIFAIFS